MTLGLASFLSIFIPTFIGFYFFDKSDKLTKYFICFITCMFIVECFANYLFYTHRPNLLIYSLSLIFETVVLLLIHMQFLKGKKLQKIILAAIVGYTIYCFLLLFNLGFSNSFYSEMRIITCIVLIFTSGIAIVQQSANTQVHILYNPLFVLSFSVLLYYGSTLFVCGALLLISDMNITSISKPIYKVHSLVNIFSNILFAFSIWLSYRQIKLSQL